MKRKILCVIITVTLLMPFTNPSIAKAEIKSKEDTKKIIVINGDEYNAQELMDRVIKYTISSPSPTVMKALNGSNVFMKYDDNQRRIMKTYENGTTTYTYNEFNQIISETIPSGDIIEYTYNYDGTVKDIIYDNNIFHYIYNNGIIVAIEDTNGKIVSRYFYDNGLCISANHKDKEKTNNIGILNSFRYDSKYFDAETGLYYLGFGNYYNSQEACELGSEVYFDEEGFFGDQYEYICDSRKQENNQRLSQQDIIDLINSASYYYTNGINYNLGSYSGNTWYTNFSGGSSYYLTARIIYAENTYSSPAAISSALQYNRQAECQTANCNRVYQQIKFPSDTYQTARSCL